MSLCCVLEEASCSFGCLKGGYKQFTLTINSMFAPTINYAHFHAAITPHPAPWGPGESPRPYLDLYCNDDP